MKGKSEWHGAESAKRSLCLAFFVLAGVLGCFTSEARIHTITNLDDGGPGSLRQEIATAHAGDTISFAVRGTILLTNGELLVTKNLRIAGPGATNLAISAGSQGRILEILP